MTWDFALSHVKPIPEILRMVPLRGACVHYDATFQKAPNRLAFYASGKSANFGFRVVAPITALRSTL